jgi:hypothetical protein
VKSNPSRVALAAMMTIVVVALLVCAVFSNSRTDGYYPFAKGAQNVDRDDHIDLTDDAADELNVKHLEFSDRVHATLHEGPIGVKSVQIPVVHVSGSQETERVDDLVERPATHGREHSLEVTAILFALFGLFVLWWGRDRASLWLGLFCSSFAPPIFDTYGVLPEWGMLLAGIVADFLFYLSIYAFLEIARTFALEAMDEHDPLLRWIERFREIALSIVVLGAVINFAETVGPTIFKESIPDAMVRLGVIVGQIAKAGVLCLGPIALLGIGWWRATDGAARSRVRITLLTTLAAESGVVYAISLAWSHGRPSGFNNYWFTLLAIPIGFFVSIQAYKVVEVKFVLKRIFVFTAMTALIAGVITLTEMWADNTMKDTLPDVILKFLDKLLDAHTPTVAQKNTVAALLRFGVAFIIVLSFSACHDMLNEFFKALFFRRRDDAVRSLRDFAMNRAPFITLREEMLQQAITLVCGSVGAHGAAFYEESGTGYALASACGEFGWPRNVGENDPAFTLLRGGRRRVDLAALHPTPSDLGLDGVAIRMAVSNRVIGSLIISGRVKESEGPYEREELEVLEDIARSVSDALFNLRANETAEFVRGVAEGSIAEAEAMQKAEALCELGLPGVDTSLRRAASKPVARRPLVTRLSRVTRDEARVTTRLPALDTERLRAD